MWDVCLVDNCAIQWKRQSKLLLLLVLQVPSEQLPVTVRACIFGEVQQASDPNRPADLCLACAAPQYSLNPNNSICDVPCPAHAKCWGGALLIPDPGYWVSAYNSDSVVTCPNAAACQGNRDSLLDCLNTSLTALSTLGHSQVSWLPSCQLWLVCINVSCTKLLCTSLQLPAAHCAMQTYGCCWYNTHRLSLDLSCQNPIGDKQRSEM